jgi:hypothetical protein
MKYLVTAMLALPLMAIAESMPRWAINPVEYKQGCYCVSVSVKPKKGPHAKRIQELIVLKMAQSEIAKYQSINIEAVTDVKQENGEATINEIIRETASNVIASNKFSIIERWRDNDDTLYILYGVAL